NTDCDYTARFNGTSSAAPNLSGVVALLLEANPRLTSRDVKDILAKTAKRPANHGRRPVQVAANRTVNRDLGPIQNGAGFVFDNWHGFGTVDAEAAVAMARSYDTPMPPVRQTSIS